LFCVVPLSLPMEAMLEKELLRFIHIQLLHFLNIQDQFRHFLEFKIRLLIHICFLVFATSPALFLENHIILCYIFLLSINFLILRKSVSLCILFSETNLQFG
jgi:hypothetical protein